jgi:hypothetical protein
MEKIRAFLNTTAGKATSVTIVCLLVIFVGYQIYGAMSPNDVAADSWTRTFVCSETDKAFKLKMEAGMTNPVPSPYSGKNTGWPPEFCGWNKDGSIRSDPFPVLLNEVVGKKGRTFCPDCGRLVIPHNPQARPGMQPPPTQTELASGKYRGAEE